MLEDQGSWYDVDGSQATGWNIASDAVACLVAPETRLESPKRSYTFSGFPLDDAGSARALAEEALPYAREAGDKGLIADALALRVFSFQIADVDAEIAEAAALLSRR